MHQHKCTMKFLRGPLKFMYPGLRGTIIFGILSSVFLFSLSPFILENISILKALQNCVPSEKMLGREV